MSPLLLKRFTATSCIGRGAAQDARLADRRARRPRALRFRDRGSRYAHRMVAGVDDQALPAELARFDCRNNRLAEWRLREDGFEEAVREVAARLGRAGSAYSSARALRNLETSWPTPGCARPGERSAAGTVRLRRDAIARSPSPISCAAACGSKDPRPSCPARAPRAPRSSAPRGA